MRFKNGPALVAVVVIAALGLVACSSEPSAAVPPAQTTEGPPTSVAAVSTTVPPTSISVPPTSVTIRIEAPEPTSTSVPSTEAPLETPTVSAPTAATSVPYSTGVPSTSTPEPELEEVASDIERFVLEDLTIPVGTTVTWTPRHTPPRQAHRPTKRMKSGVAVR